MNDELTQWHQAADAIQQADALMITAGAGMGVDSGLPDFRGDTGFWKAYPMLQGRSFVSMANPQWFELDPKLAWGFYGHRMNLYRATSPHAGFTLLHQWASSKPGGCFVFTSNVDGHFQKAGFPESHIVECHGSLGYLQCSRCCHLGIWSSDSMNLEIDTATLRTISELPKCPRCQQLARPNVLMFNDYQWISDRTDAQVRQCEQWLYTVLGKKLVTIEMGAGTAVPTVRYFSERLPGTLIRINVREPEVPANGIGIAAPAKYALEQLDALMKSDG